MYAIIPGEVTKAVPWDFITWSLRIQIYLRIKAF